MGVVCCGARGGDFNADRPGPHPDEVNPQTHKPEQIFEKNLPFFQTHISAFVKRVRAAADAGGNKSTVQIAELRKTFTTPAWKDLADDNSRISQIFKHKVLAAKDGSIDVTNLIAFGILHCEGDWNYKTDALYDLLQEGGQAAHTHISAQDKDILPVLRKMMMLATRDIGLIMKDLC